MFMLLSFAFAGSAMGAAAKPAKAAAGKATKTSCRVCHADFATVLPKDHAKVQGDGIASCVSCHKPDTSGEPKKNAFSARMHKAHTGTKPGVECTVCHAWVPGKSFGLTGVKGSMGKLTREEMEALGKSFASWTHSGYTDNLHAKGGIVCAGCHGKDLPKPDAAVENGRCLACHGPEEELVKKSASADFPDRNPHKSHLAQINCTVCHAAHGPSKVYCLDCHKNFNMKIPGAGK
jgi:hypothetical protein